MARLVEEPPQQAPKLTEEFEPFSPWQTVKNIPGSAVQFGKDITQPIRHPIDTAEALWRAGSGAVELAIPGEQGNEPVARAVGQGLKDRYGGAQQLRRTLQNDPVGMAADVAGLLTGGSSLAARGGLKGAEMAGRVGRALDPVAALRKVAGKAIPSALPRSMMESSLKLSTTMKRADRAGVVETALREGVTPSERGVSRLRRKQAGLGDQIDDLIAQAGAQGGSVPVEAVTQGLDAVRQKLGRPSVAGAKDLADVNAVESAFLDHVNRNGPARLTIEDLQHLKTDAYKRINFDRPLQRVTPGTEEAYRSISRDARGEIEKQVPAIADVNRRYGDIERALPAVERAANRVGNRDLMGIGTPIKSVAGTAAGTALGGPVLGAAAGFGAGLFDLPRFKARTAIIAEALRKGAANPKTFTKTRAALAQAGRTAEGQDEGGYGY